MSAPSELAMKAAVEVLGEGWCKSDLEDLAELIERHTNPLTLLAERDRLREALVTLKTWFDEKSTNGLDYQELWEASKWGSEVAGEALSASNPQ